jgi:hypothetical protein
MNAKVGSTNHFPMKTIADFCAILFWGAHQEPTIMLGKFRHLQFPASD